MQTVSKKKILGVIPARYQSSRFPGKPLAMIEGQSMIMRVYEQAKKCVALHEVIVATDNKAIFGHVNAMGGKAVMTSENHESGTERCAEALQKTEEEFDIVINIQGDEPFINPAQIEKVIDLFSESDVKIGTLVKRISDLKQLKSPNNVKAVVGTTGDALYFSRSVIPFVRDTEEEKWFDEVTFFKHIGLYGYQSKTLKELVELETGVLEKAESLEQLRWITNGYKIKTAETEEDAAGIDTYEDLLEAVKKLKSSN